VKKPKKLRGRTRELASKYVAEEVRTGKFPRRQAIAVGISRAREEARRRRRAGQVRDIMARYR
jgi:hypothetical protein